MTDSTQLADQFLLQSSLRTDSSVKVSRGKSVAIVNDGQSGSYSSGIVSFDCQSALNGSQGFSSLKDAYIVLPYVVSMKNTGTADAGALPTRYALGMKCNIASIVDEVKVYLNGKSIITPSEYKQIWGNVRAMVELSSDEVEKHGADSFLYPDDWESITHSAAAGTAGDGYSNNSLTGNSSLSLSSGEHTRCNTGFVRRVLNNPPEVAGTSDSHGWPSLKSTSSQAIAQMRGTGGFKKGTPLTPGSVLGEWFYMLKIRLVDLHPIFSEIDLVGNPQLKLELKVQTGYSDLTLAPNAAVAGRTMKLDSTTLVAGSVCPVMIGASATKTIADSMNDVIGGVGKSTALRIAWGPIHNSITPIATAGSFFPFTQARLNLPFYDVANPTALVSKPMKQIKYLDCYSQMFSAGEAGVGSMTTNKNFSIQVASSHKNVKYVVAIPFANTASGNFATASSTQQFASPFDSAPWTCQPGSSIRDFQVQVGNKNVFQDSNSYDWQNFLDEFSKVAAINGDLSREISNGLIGMDKWQTAQRILVADTSRISEADVPQSIKVSGTNVSTQGTNLLVLLYMSVLSSSTASPERCSVPIEHSHAKMRVRINIIKICIYDLATYIEIIMSTLTFGKHKSKSIEEVYASDPGYCRWLSNQKSLVEDSSNIGKFLKEKFSNDDGSFLMTFGKYKHKTIKQIQTIDPEYLEWLKKNDFIQTKMPKLKAEVDELLK